MPYDESHNDEWFVAFYGPRVAQTMTPTLQEARFALRRLALEAAK